MKADKYRLISLEEAINHFGDHTHASHVLFWTVDDSRDNQMVFGLMQMRSDGRFGFPGGTCDEPKVDSDEIVSALYREVHEEMDYKMSERQITIEDRLFSHLSKSRKVLHFFAKELPLKTFSLLERTHINARDFPSESVGLIRVPLRDVGQPSSPAVRKFFKGFGRQKLAGNAKTQLIDAIIRLGLIGEQDIQFVTKAMVR